MTTERFFARPSIKALGITGAVFFLGLALGNGYRTQDALRGQSQWYRQWCGQQVERKLEQHEMHDALIYGPPRHR